MKLNLFIFIGYIITLHLTSIKSYLYKIEKEFFTQSNMHYILFS